MNVCITYPHFCSFFDRGTIVDNPVLNLDDVVECVKHGLQVDISHVDLCVAGADDGTVTCATDKER